MQKHIFGQIRSIPRSVSSGEICPLLTPISNTGEDSILTIIIPKKMLTQEGKFVKKLGNLANFRNLKNPENSSGMGRRSLPLKLVRVWYTMDSIKLKTKI